MEQAIDSGFQDKINYTIKFIYESDDQERTFLDTMAYNQTLLSKPGQNTNLLDIKKLPKGKQ